MRVGKCDCFAGGAEESQAVIERDAAIDVLIQPLTADVLHHIKDASIRKCAQVMHRHDTRMLKPGDDICLAPHPFDHPRIHFRRVEHFDCDFAIKARITSAIDGSHATTCDLIEQLVPGLCEVRTIGNLEQTPDLLIR